MTAVCPLCCDPGAILAAAHPGTFVQLPGPAQGHTSLSGNATGRWHGKKDPKREVVKERKTDGQRQINHCAQLQGAPLTGSVFDYVMMDALWSSQQSGPLGDWVEDEEENQGGSKHNCFGETLLLSTVFSLFFPLTLESQQMSLSLLGLQFLHVSSLT